MSKRYDLINRLKAANERPFIMITEDKTYSVDTSKTAALHMQAISKDESLDEIGKLDKIIEVTLGKKASKEISEMNFSMEALGLIVEAIAASLGGEELEEIKTRFPEEETK